MPLTIVSWNVNSFRSAIRKDFLIWLQKTSPDIVCLQEIRGTALQLQPIEPLLTGYEAIWHPAIRPGYAGTGILTKYKPQTIEYGLNGANDPEGRALTIDFGSFRIASFYTQNAVPGTAKIAEKNAWFQELCTHVTKRSEKPFIVCGDLNVAQSRLDSRDESHPNGVNGCTDEERAAFEHMLDVCHLYDPVRARHQETVLSTWWHATTSERRPDNGIRFDYTLIPETCRNLVQAAIIQTDVSGSDHCPTSVTMSLPVHELRTAYALGQACLL